MTDEASRRPAEARVPARVRMADEPPRCAAAYQNVLP